MKFKNSKKTTKLINYKNYTKRKKLFRLKKLNAKIVKILQKKYTEKNRCPFN